MWLDLGPMDDLRFRLLDTTEHRKEYCDHDQRRRDQQREQDEQRHEHHAERDDEGERGGNVGDQEHEEESGEHSEDWHDREEQRRKRIEQRNGQQPRQQQCRWNDRVVKQIAHAPAERCGLLGRKPETSVFQQRLTMLQQLRPDPRRIIQPEFVLTAHDARDQFVAKPGFLANLPDGSADPIHVVCSGRLRMVLHPGDEGRCCR